MVEICYIVERKLKNNFKYKNMKEQTFEKWLIEKEEKAQSVAKAYSRAINKISEHYSMEKKVAVDLYYNSSAKEIEEIANDYGKEGVFKEFGNYGNGTYRFAIKAFSRYVSYAEENIGFVEENLNFEEIANYTYEADLKDAIVKQINLLFPDFHLYKGNKGIEYKINGKFIDILLENNNNGDLLVVELKSGSVGYKVFGQISMYIGMIQEKFPTKKVRGCIIAGKIESELFAASTTTNLLDLKTYDIKVNLKNTSYLDYKDEQINMFLE